MGSRFSLPAHRADNTTLPLRHRFAALWTVLALLSLPTGFVLAGAAGLNGFPLALFSPASIVLLADIVMGDHLDLGDYAGGQSEKLFLAGQALSR